MGNPIQFVAHTLFFLNLTLLVHVCISEKIPYMVVWDITYITQGKRCITVWEHAIERYKLYPMKGDEHGDFTRPSVSWYVLVNHALWNITYLPQAWIFIIIFPHHGRLRKLVAAISVSSQHALILFISFHLSSYHSVISYPDYFSMCFLYCFHDSHDIIVNRTERTSPRVFNELPKQLVVT